MGNIPERRIETETTRRLRKEKDRRFLKGPVPLRWMIKAMRLPGASPFKISMVLWYRKGLTKSAIIKLSKQVAEDFGLSTRTVYRALSVLEKAGLVQVTRNPGKSPVVKIIEDQNEKS